MGLFDFCRVNLPYCVERTEHGWRCLNREYQQLGGNATGPKTPESTATTATQYKGLTPRFIESLVDDPQQIHRDAHGDIIKFFLYRDDTAPTYPGRNSDTLWKSYSTKLHKLAKLEVKP